MGKQEDLEKLDKAVRERMLKCLEDNKTDLLPELNVVVQYLAKNNVIADKKKSTVEDDIRKRLEQANKRRASNGE